MSSTSRPALSPGGGTTTVLPLSSEEWVHPSTTNTSKQTSPGQASSLKFLRSKAASSGKTANGGVNTSDDKTPSSSSNTTASNSTPRAKNAKKYNDHVNGHASAAAETGTSSGKKSGSSRGGGVVPVIPTSLDSGKESSTPPGKADSLDGAVTLSGGLSRSNQSSHNATNPRKTAAEVSNESLDSYRTAVANLNSIHHNHNNAIGNSTNSPPNAPSRGNTRRATVPQAPVKPEPPSQAPSGNLFRRTFSVTDTTPSGRAPQHNAPNSSRGPNVSSYSTPPPTAPTPSDVPVPPHASSAPRERRPSETHERERDRSTASSSAAHSPRTPKPKAPFYMKPTTPAPTPSATPPRTVSPRTPGELVRGRGGSFVEPESRAAASARGTGNTSGADKGSSLPPLVPQGSRSGIPRTLAGSTTTTPSANHAQKVPSARQQSSAAREASPSSAVPSLPAASTPPTVRKAPSPLSVPTANAAASRYPQSSSLKDSPKDSASDSPQPSRQPPLQSTFGFSPRASHGGTKAADSNDENNSSQRRSSSGHSNANNGHSAATGAGRYTKTDSTSSSGSSGGAKGSKDPKAGATSTPAASSSPPPKSSAQTSHSTKSPSPGAPPKNATTATPPKETASPKRPSVPTAAAADAKPVANTKRPAMPPLSADMDTAPDILNPAHSLVGFTAIEESEGKATGGKRGSNSTATTSASARTPSGAADREDAKPSATPQPIPTLVSPPKPGPKLSGFPAIPAYATGGERPVDISGNGSEPAMTPNHILQLQQQQHMPLQRPVSSALAHRSSVRPGPGGGGGGCQGTEHSKGANLASEAAALASYLNEEELNLSMSTFTTLGSALSSSVALRVLNLRGSTMPSEGLRGLADIPTLQSICVSHMRRLTSLKPLITPTSSHLKCGLLEIDAQCTPLNNEGLLGLEKLPRLRKLDLSMTGVTDVSSLSGSHSLKELYLALTQVNSNGLRGLEKIPTLVTLNVSRTKVTNITSLTASRSLHTLLLYSCKCTDDDIKGIERMPRLAVVDLSTTKVTDLSVFRSSPSLASIKAQWLSLRNCIDLIQERRASMNDGGAGVNGASGGSWQEMEAGYAGLAEIPTLETVDLSFNAIRSVRSLCTSTSIKHLILRRTRVDSAGIAEIYRLSHTLETLEVTNLTDNLEENDEDDADSLTGSATSSGNGMLCNVTVLSRLSRLTRVDLSFTDVFDLRVLRELRQLKELVIVETLVTVDGLRGVEEIPTLELLDLSQTSVMSLQFLAGGAPSLKTILVKSNRNVRGFRLGRIEGLPALESLDISDTVVEDIRLMWTPKWPLKELIWRWRERREAVGPVPPLACWVTSDRLTGLASMPRLEKLDIANSVVLNLEFLKGAKHLKSLNLDGCRLLRDEHLAAIANETFVRDSLETLNLANNPHLTDVTCLSQCRCLQSLSIVNDTSLQVPGLEGVWNLPTIKNLEIANSGAEDSLWRSQQADMNAALEGSVRANSQGANPSVNNNNKSNGGRGTSGSAATDAWSAYVAGGGGDGGSSKGGGAKTSHSDGAGGRQAGDGKGSSHAGTGPSDTGKKHDSERRSRRSKNRHEEGTLRDVSAVLDSSAAPVEFRVPRRRRVSFVMLDPPGPSNADVPPAQ